MQEMDEESINKKHLRVRGTLNLKYPPNESRCGQTCGDRHDIQRNEFGREFIREHRCFLKIGHEGYCEFSSACDRAAA